MSISFPWTLCGQWIHFCPFITNKHCYNFCRREDKCHFRKFWEVKSSKIDPSHLPCREDVGLGLGLQTTSSWIIHCITCVGFAWIDLQETMDEKRKSSNWFESELVSIWWLTKWSAPDLARSKGWPLVVVEVLKITKSWKVQFLIMVEFSQESNQFDLIKWLFPAV